MPLSTTSADPHSDLRHLPPFSAAAVAASLADGVPWLRFPNGLEAVFEADTGARRSRQLLIQGFPALLIMNACLVLDYLGLPEVFWLGVLLRVGVVTSASLLIMWVLTRNPPSHIREGMEAVINLISAAIILVLVAASDSPMADYYHFGILLVLMFAVMVQRIRFWYMLPTALGVFAIDVATILVTDLPPVAQLGSAMMMAGTVTFSLMASYTLEREERMLWLHSINDRMRSNRFEAMSTIDPLTGLGNRRALEQALSGLEKDWQDGKGVALAIADIDHFKAYNDTFGHIAGDECLCRVAGILVAAVSRDDGAIFRFGGEEFVVLLPSTDLAAATAICERAREAVQACAIPHDGSVAGGRVTVSIGLALPAPDAPLDQDALIFAADARLYIAKESGRNRVATPRTIDADDLAFSA